MFDYTYLGIENASFETIVNAYVGDAVITTGWADRLVVWAQSPKVNILAIDYYPGTWVWASFDQWAPLTHLFNIANSYGKKCAIMETGFSTWASEDTPSWILVNYWHTEDDQENFINIALPIIRGKSASQNSWHPNNKMLLATWYELIGSDPSVTPYICGLPNSRPSTYASITEAEANFGICKDDFTIKIGYDNLQININYYYKM
ncbi:MAG: hypothetical protein QW620_06465 [Thermoplasmata archaeon]